MPRSVRVVWVVVALVLALGACAPGTPDDNSWRGDATRAVSDVSSALRTARLVLQERQRGRVYGPYLQTVLVEAEKNAGLAAQGLSSVQPPGAELDRSSSVTDQLDQATGLLGDARIAVVAGHTGEFDDLIEKLGSLAADLDRTETALGHPPRRTS